MLGSAPKCTNTFPIGDGIDSLSDLDVMQLLTLVWTDRKVLRLVAGGKLSLKFNL